MAKPLPVFFFGHGNPMNAIRDSAATRRWSEIGKRLPPPRAILAVSAHWYIPGLAVTAMEHPRTIHDFGGFPPELYRVEYPAPGSPALALRVRELLGPLDVERDLDWGLDHGTWSVLARVFPRADVPVVELSLDETRRPEAHVELGRRLGPLRDEGVLVVASGNVVHNLQAYSWDGRPTRPFDWAVRFENAVRELLVSGQDRPLIDYETLGPDARLAVPTPDHYLPLLYVLGLRRPGETVQFPVDGFDGGSISMLSVEIG